MSGLYEEWSYISSASYIARIQHLLIHCEDTAPHIARIQFLSCFMSYIARIQSSPSRIQNILYYSSKDTDTMYHPLQEFIYSDAILSIKDTGYNVTLIQGYRYNVSPSARIHLYNYINPSPLLYKIILLLIHNYINPSPLLYKITLLLIHNYINPSPLLYKITLLLIHNYINPSPLLYKKLPSYKKVAPLIQASLIQEYIFSYNTFHHPRIQIPSFSILPYPDRIPDLKEHV